MKRTYTITLMSDSSLSQQDEAEEIQDALEHEFPDAVVVPAIVPPTSLVPEKPPAMQQNAPALTNHQPPLKP